MSHSSQLARIRKEYRLYSREELEQEIVPVRQAIRAIKGDRDITELEELSSTLLELLSRQRVILELLRKFDKDS